MHRKYTEHHVFEYGFCIIAAVALAVHGAAMLIAQNDWNISFY